MSLIILHTEMNIVIRSGYLSWTEMIVRCRSLNKYFHTSVSFCDYRRYSKQGKILYIKKGKRGVCTNCFRRKSVRVDPFCWLPGLLCSFCMPETLTRTRVLRMLNTIERGKKIHTILERLDRINKRSPFGTTMTLYLSVDVHILINTVTKCNM